MITQPAKRHRVAGIVMDGTGDRLNAVQIDITWLTPPTEYFGEFHVAGRKTVIVDGAFDIDFHGSSLVRLEFHKEGYESVTYEVKSKKYSLENARFLMEHGFVLPQMKGDGDVIIRLQKPLRWDPPAYSDSAAVTPDRKEWPDSIPADAPVIVRSDDPRVVAVRVDGTYVVVDRNLKVLWLGRFPRGYCLGFEHAIYNGNKLQMVSTWGGGVSLKEAEGPYTWRLYSKAVPVGSASHPTSAPAASTVPATATRVAAPGSDVSRPVEGR